MVNVGLGFFAGLGVGAVAMLLKSPAPQGDPVAMDQTPPPAVEGRVLETAEPDSIFTENVVPDGVATDEVASAGVVAEDAVSDSVVPDEPVTEDVAEIVPSSESEPDAAAESVLTNIQPTSALSEALSEAPSEAPDADVQPDLPGEPVVGLPTGVTADTPPEDAAPAKDPVADVPPVDAPPVETATVEGLAEESATEEAPVAEAPIAETPVTDSPDALAELDAGPASPAPDISPAPPAPASADAPPPPRPTDLVAPASPTRPVVGPAPLRPEAVASATLPTPRPTEGEMPLSAERGPFTPDAAAEDRLRELGRPDTLETATDTGALPVLAGLTPPAQVFAWATPPVLETPGARPAPVLASAPADPPFRSALVLLGATGTSGLAPVTDTTPPEPVIVIPNSGDLMVWIFAEPSVDEDMIDTTRQVVAQLGLPVRRIVRVDYQISENQVRFYDTWAAEGAGVLADGLHAAPRDFVGSGYNPDGGVLEIYLANEDAVHAPFRGAGGTGASTGIPETVEEKLRDSLLSKLRDE